MARRRKSTPIAAVLIALLVAAAVYFLRDRLRPHIEQEPAPGPAAGRLTLRFLDVGQGDATLLQLPDGGAILIDAGDRGAPTVELLKKYGVRQLDLAIATHPHADHIGEMVDVLRAFPVKEVWDAGFPYSTRTYLNMLQEIKDRNVRFETPRRGAARRFGDVLVEVLHPGPRFFDGEEANNASIVVRVSYGAKRFLFTGDAEIDRDRSVDSAWEEMLETEPDKLRADLLKAAHHGSSNGTTRQILDAVRPSIFTISCGAGNDYHHPHPSVVALLEGRRDAIAVYRTDLQGTITAVCDGQTIEMSAERQVDADRLYLTGDEVAGKVATGGGAPRGRGNRGGR